MAADADAEACLRGALSKLDGHRRRVLELRYGLGAAPSTYDAVAGQLGVSRTRVQLVENQALRELAARPELQALRAAA